MKTSLYFAAAVAFVLSSCTGNKNKNFVYEHIDSIYTAHKKELSQTKDNLQESRNQLPELRVAEKELASKLEFRKDERYETEGFYYAPKQTIENTPVHSFMAQVGERGTLIASAILPLGAKPSAIQLLTANGNKYECDMEYSDFRTVFNKQVMGFSSKSSYELLQFISANQGQPIKMIIDGNASSLIPQSSVSSLIKVYALYDAMKKRQDKELIINNDSLHIEFMNRKLKEEEEILNSKR